MTQPDSIPPICGERSFCQMKFLSHFTGVSLLWGKYVVKCGIENSSGSPYQRLMTTYGNNVEIDSSPAATMSGLLYIYVDSTMKL